MKLFIFTLRLIMIISSLIFINFETKIEINNFINYNIIIIITFIVFNFLNELTNYSKNLKRENDLIILIRKYLVLIINFDLKKLIIKRIEN
jgi:hypothetical protein